MSSRKAFDANRIAQSLIILDAWRGSAQPLRAFATRHGHKYDQLRAWLRHEPRWREQARADPANHLKHFVPVRINTNAPECFAPHAAPSIHIECASGDGKRTASVHFPLLDAEISAQWLVAFMSA